MSSAPTVVSPDMSNVIVEISMSLDAFATGPNQTPEQPLGEGGEQLHAWLADDREVETRSHATVRAIVCGRRTYGDSLPWWGPDGPSGDARIPVVVVTHDRDPAPDGSVYTFVDGVEAALDQARELAQGGDVTVMGGPDVINQCLGAGLVGELWLHVVPTLLGGGTPLFERTQIGLEPIDAVPTAAATHLRYRVIVP